ncbi:unnamed protein product [Blepharisma stoltei]|uniref:Transglycosylase SLT domain-containing protein n=1 Tax=Blepharisma stoltei TaxID=1481888 RepID=A0AAU9IU51_9CILI|nr:unnamed protein product [Blepharisma stoltei]
MKSITLIALFLACAYANTCGGNCPSNDCTSCLCGTTKDVVSIASWCSQYSGWSQTCCQCIASHESGGNANAQNHNTNGSNDIGLWQINSANWDSCSGGSAPCNPSTNLACAKKVWGWGGNTWKLWSTCSGCNCCSKAEEDEFLRLEAEERLRAQSQEQSVSHKIDSENNELNSGSQL